MTTPTPHGAMPELSESTVRAIMASAGFADNAKSWSGGVEEMRYIIRAAIQQAAGAVPELPEDEIIAMARLHSSENHYSGGRCVRMEFTRSNILTFARALAASPTPPASGGSSDHLVPCAGDRVQVPLTDERIDQLAEAMPGGVLGFLKDWGYRQFARSILALRTMPAWEPEFCGDCEQIELAEKFCLEIAGKRGQKGSPPDPVRLLEMAQALYLAERKEALHE